MGVAAVELTFDYLIDELLEVADVPEAKETFLLDKQGNIVVRSSKKGKEYRSASRVRTVRMPAFPVPEVVEAIQAKRSGYLEVDGELHLFNRMNSLGWYYVVSGSVDDMF